VETANLSDILHVGLIFYACDVHKVRVVEAAGRWVRGSVGPWVRGSVRGTRRPSFAQDTVVTGIIGQCQFGR
jgi:hypothetical protein